MKERPGAVTFTGNPLTLVGDEPKVGDTAPDFVVLGNDLAPVAFSSFRGKACIISSVPSLDTPVCDIMTRKFNEEASKLGPDVKILTISMDLPFAQARWCGAGPRPPASGIRPECRDSSGKPELARSHRV